LRIRQIAIFVCIVQAILLVAHAFLYETCRAFLWPQGDARGAAAFVIAMAVLSLSFVAASLLAWRFNNIVMRAFYRIAAVWLGAVNYLLGAALGCWAALGVALLCNAAGKPAAIWDVDSLAHRREMAVPLFALAIAVTIYGVVNAARTRVTRVTVALPNLPPSWRGRTAVLVGDSHLGHVRGIGFARRIAGMVAALQPDVVFHAGDLYDGTAADLDRLAEPWGAIPSRFGVYFVLGNHEEFSNHDKYIRALDDAGVRVLNNEKVTLDGLQLVGVHYRDGRNPVRLRAILRRAALNANAASVLLIHAPDHLAIAEEAGVSLQLSGHTHRGQFFPWTLAVKRVYGRFAYGLQRLRDLQVYTTCGAGTWGPPLRVGSNPEIVLFTFE
jgi:uncharacterized protein